MAKKTRAFETPNVLHDAPLRDSDTAHFHFDEFSVTLARLIAAQSTRTPLTIGVSGPWGSGKTTLLRRLKNMLDATSNLAHSTQPALLGFANDQETPEKFFRVCRTVWFDAWKYAQENQVLAALLRLILTEMQAGGFWQQIRAALNGPKREDVRWLGLLLNGLAQFASAGTYDLNLKDFTVDTPFREASAFFDYFDDSLTHLLASWVGGKLVGKGEIDESQGALVVFIDDLDRCLPAKTVQVLEAVKLFLDKPGCIFVLGADVNVIQQAIAKHYADAGVTGESAKDYLEKVIQLRFELPPIQADAMKVYLEAEQSVDEAIQRNWQILVTGAEINPRKIKTFVNDLNLQWAILKNTGQAEGVDRDDFTRWQILMRAAPMGFRHQFYNLPDDTLDDQEHRLKFITDALHWANGEASLETTFQAYVDSIRLQRVLRVIQSFGTQFNAEVLHAFVHLTAPPKVKAALPEPSLRTETEEALPPKGLARKAEGVARVLVSVQTFGGIEFVRVPAGKFVMGSRDDNPLAADEEKPQHTIEIPYDYWMARYPVTNQQFAKFVEAEKSKPDWIKEWADKLTHPVVNVTWYVAMGYCRWLNETLRLELPGGTAVCLPSEAEWEKAARGEYGNEWPWGNEFDPARCNTSESGKGGTTPVRAYTPQGDSPCGCADMAGNMWEWTRSLFKGYPYDPKDGREDLDVTSGRRVLRGGCFDIDARGARCAYRLRLDPDFGLNDVGFRVVVSPTFSTHSDL